jgi:hypothetical protein
MNKSVSKRPQVAGDWIPVVRVTGSAGVSVHTPCENLIGSLGMNTLTDKTDTHDNDSRGATMWLAAGMGHPHAADHLPWVCFDFGATYPVGEMWVWNYNQRHPSIPDLFRRGLKNVKIEYSLNGHQWTELKGAGYPYRFACADGSPSLAATNLDDGAHSPVRFGNALARFVRITAAGGVNEGNWGGCGGNEPFYGLSAVRFYAGTGIAAEPAVEWTQLFRRQSGWTGSDGIYSIPFDGRETYADDERRKTIFVFGDTFIGEVDGATDRRYGEKMINNTTAVLEGHVPARDKITFQWGTAKDGTPESSFVPTTERALSIPDTYYWLQDGASVNGKFYCFPMIIGPNPDGPEGFQFSTHGVTRVSAPIDPERGILFDRQEQVDTDLYYVAHNGCRTHFGAAIVPNTEESGAPEPDGCVYIYGLQSHGCARPVVARVPAEQFEDFSKWTFWNGSGWSSVKEEAVPIAEEVSPEFSLSPNPFAGVKGKYVIVYQTGGVVGHHLCVAFGDSLTGPFEPGVRIYYCQEPEEGKNIYTYNAKAHPHLSPPGELLASYNVNTTSWACHELYGSIYRPRFVRIRYIVPS